MPKKHQKNNKGFSLLELLVAIAILATVMIPMLHSFVSAARANAKAKKLMEATTAAQNVMEEVKISGPFKFLEDHTNYSKEQASYKDASGNIVTISDTYGNPVYIYDTTIVSSPALTVNGREYRAKVKFDPQNYTCVTGASVSTTEYNSFPFARLSKLSKDSNGFYIQNSDQELIAAKTMDPAAYEEIKSNMSRTITIDIDYTPDTKIVKVYATVTYKDERPGETNEDTPVNRKEIYNNSVDPTHKTLSNIFICYFPMYNNTSVDSPKEHFVINNDNNFPVCVYLAKQTTRDTSTNPEYAANSNVYRVSLDVKEGIRASLTGKNDDGTDNGKPDVITSVATNLRVDDTPTAREIDVTYEHKVAGGSYTSGGIPAGYAPKDMVKIKDLQRADYENRIYDVTVSVYDKKDGSYEKALTTISGSAIQ